MTCILEQISKNIVIFIIICCVGSLIWCGCSEDDDSTQPIPAGPYIYVASGNAGVNVVSVQDPQNPLYATAFHDDSDDEEKPAYNIAFRQQHLLITQGSYGLSIINVSDVNALERVGGYSTFGSYYGISVQGDYAYVTDFEDEIIIMDVSFPALPYPWTTIAVDTIPLSTFVTGNLLYCALGKGGLGIYDISQSDAPILLSQYETEDDASSVVVENETAYLTIMKNGLVLIDVTDPENPVELSTQNTPGTALELTVVNSYAYVADSVAGLQVIDCNDLSNPQIVGSNSPGPPLLDVIIQGNYAYCAAGDDGIIAFDISDPTRPQILKTLDLDGHSTNLVGE